MFLVISWLVVDAIAGSGFSLVPTSGVDESATVESSFLQNENVS